MSQDGPLKVEDLQIVDIPFLYPERISALAGKLKPPSKMDAGLVITTEPTPRLTTNIDDDFDISELDSLSPLQKPQFQARMDLSSKAADDVIEEHKLSLLDFLIARAGYPLERAEDYSERYRAQFESMILEEDGIFEKFFLQVKKNIEEIKNADNAGLKKHELIVKEAREKALSDLGPGVFERLGSYYSPSSKYYFEENDLSKSLSNHFLSQLYQNPVLAKKMLQSQADKTKGQYAGMLEEFVKLLPYAYNGTIDELKSVENDFELFLLSPSILAIAQGKVLSTSKKSSSRADLLSNLHDMLEIIHNDRLRHNFTMADMFSPALTRPEDLPHDTTLVDAFSRLSIREDSDITPLMYVDQHLMEFREILKAHNIEFFDSHSFEAFRSLNPTEMVFVVQKFMLDFMKNAKKPEVAAEQHDLQRQIKAKELELKQEKTRVTIEYLALNHSGKELSVLTKELRGGMKQVNENIQQACANDHECKKIVADIEVLQEQSKTLQNTLDSLDKKIKAFKNTFIAKFYPEIVPVANGLTQSYRKLLLEEEDNTSFLKNGGTYSCLTFLPIKIKDSSGLSDDRFECLVAMSGAELDIEHAVNAHAVLKAFAQDMGTVNIPGQGDFNFRYVGPGSSALELLLKQIGKGLSGSENALSPLKGDVLPIFEKACAEKRLINELIALFSLHGEQVQVLGCDNIALPKYTDITPERQKALRSLNTGKVSTPVKASGKASAKASSSSVAKVSPFFAIQAKLELDGAEQEMTLGAEHITCCSSCQAQKPAVMTVLFNAFKQSEKLAAKQNQLALHEVKMDSKAASCGSEHIVITPSDGRQLVTCSSI